MPGGAWWGTLSFYRKVSAVAGASTAVIAALLAVANATRTAEPYWIATRGYVADEVNAAVIKVQDTQNQFRARENQIELQVVNGRIEYLRGEISNKQLVLQTDGPPQYKQLAQQQIDDLTYRLKNLTEQQERLQAAIRGANP